MKALCDRKALLAAFGMVGGVISARSPRPILQNLKFDVGREVSTLSATDMEVGIRRQVLGVKVSRPGSVILPKAEIKRLATAIRDAEVEITVTNGQVRVESLGSVVFFPSADPSLFPDFPDFESTSFHVVAAADLKRLIKRTVFAAQKKSVRCPTKSLQGVLFELTDKEIVLIGTDGTQLARAVASAESVNGAEPTSGQPVVPVKALKLIERNLDEDGPPVHIAFPTANSVLIRANQAVIYSQLVKGRFPVYKNKPSMEPELFAIDRDLLIAELSLAEITVENLVSKGIELTLEQGKLGFSGGGDIPVGYFGEPKSISVNHGQILKFLLLLPKGCPLLFGFGGSNSPFFLKSDASTYLSNPFTTGGPTPQAGFTIL